MSSDIRWTAASGQPYEQAWLGETGIGDIRQISPPDGLWWGFQVTTPGNAIVDSTRQYPGPEAARAAFLKSWNQIQAGKYGGDEWIDGTVERLGERTVKARRGETATVRYAVALLENGDQAEFTVGQCVPDGTDFTRVQVGDSVQVRVEDGSVTVPAHRPRR